jgi:hypothetical protein
MIDSKLGRIIEQSEERSDCTSSGKFRLFNETTTLKEVLNNLDKEEWGDIYINFKIKYKYSEIDFPKELEYLLNKNVYSFIDFSGGWTKMDYYINLHD